MGALALVLWGRRPPSASPSDNTALVADALSKAVTQAAEAIGRAVQTAQAPVPEPPRVVRRVWRDDPDIESGIVDAFDPTDADGWLSPERPTVAFVDDGELERMMQRGPHPD